MNHSLRLLSCVQLAQPVDSLRHAIYAWASGIEGNAVYTPVQFERLRTHAAAAHRASPEDKDAAHLNHDFHLACGALSALEKRPPGGWSEYVQAFTNHRLSLRIRSISEFSLLRNLEVQVGGILLNDRACPLVLILPQPGGTWIQMGWESVIELADSPFESPAADKRILRAHAAEASEGEALSA